MLRLLTKRTPQKRYISSKISNWNTSDVITDRKSKFQARNVEIQQESQLEDILSQFLLQHKSIAKNASHPHILAWRTGEKLSNGKVININQGFKDNGEKGAGIRLLEQVLVKYDLINVLVIVTRWYGGSPIGNLRFRHINNSALDSLRKSNKI